MTSSYDYIIAGGGCAGLSLAMRMIHNEQLSQKKILIVDKEIKSKNDRTWCYWEAGPGYFENLVHRSWKQVWFHCNEFSRLLEIAPYQYKMIRGVDFYSHCLKILREHPNVEFRLGNIESIDNEAGSLRIEGNEINASLIFNSIIFEKPKKDNRTYLLLQHFKGWVIRTPTPQFDPENATLMDFRVPQNNGTTFCYVLPLSETTALVEFTLFSEEILSSGSYDIGLKYYLNEVLYIEDYEILEEEFGVIPMTNHKFTRKSGKVVNLGTAGGMTKSSSGYTFYFIQKHSDWLVENLARTGQPPTNHIFQKKFSYFDSVLLNVLSSGKLSGEKIFSSLFKKNDPVNILQFLNNESSPLTDLRIISSLPTIPFLKAGLQQL